MDKQKIVLFLGAGFSFEAHQPIMNKFGKFSEGQLYGFPPFNGIIKHKKWNAYDLLKKSGEIFEGFRKYCKVQTKLNQFNDNMEELFTLAEMMKECGYKYLTLNIEDIETNENKKIKISIHNLLISIHLWLWQIFRRIPLNNPNKWPVKQKPYKEFIRILNNYGTKNFHIITTNYDLILEYLCNQEGIKVHYPLNQFQFEKDICHPHHPSTGAFVSGYNGERDKDSLTICKLHGSINFFRENNTSNTNLKVIADTGGKVGKSKIVDLLPTITALDSIYELYKNRNLIPFIIPPTYAKLSGFNWMKPTWKNSAEALSEADKWIFIGYSFPASDGHIKSLINLAFINRNKVPDIKIIAPKEDEAQIISNYKHALGKDIFKNDIAKFHGKKFSEFIMDGDFLYEIKKL